MPTPTTATTPMTASPRAAPRAHGTFAQPPMSHAGESYNMSDMSSYDYSAAAASAVCARAAGVGAMGLNRARSTTQPYNAFAVPYTRALPLRSGSCRCEDGGVSGIGHRRHFVYAMYVV